MGDGDWSPDDAPENEAFAPVDEAFDDADRLDREHLEQVALDPALNPSVVVDERELEELGAEFDDPEQLVTLAGGADDPDGLGGPSEHTRARLADHEGWDLDAEEPGAGA